jgi:hypothetical protein
MRSAMKPASLGELMGAGYEHRDKLTLDDIPKLLGHKMPEITFDRVGRLRLHHALQQRFGRDYMNMPHIRDLLSQHAEQMKLNAQIAANRRSHGGE